jgi:hypothetical protein
LAVLGSHVEERHPFIEGLMDAPASLFSVLIEAEVVASEPDDGDPDA